MYRKLVFNSLLLAAIAVAAPAQDTSYNGVAQDRVTQAQTSTTTQIEPLSSSDISEIRVVTRTVKAISYEHKGGATKVEFRSTDLMPTATGEAKVSSAKGRTAIDSQFQHFLPARHFGPEYLTYVLWAITPQGRPVNLGELVPNDDGKGALKATSDLQTFGMLVTAEPYFSVTRPSNMVVLENVARSDTKGREVPIETKFEALQRGDYTVKISPAELPATAAAPKTPLELLEARNAVAIARAAQADHYAPDAYARAVADLSRAEQDYQSKGNNKEVTTAARAAAQGGEDARLLSIQRREQERVAAQRREEQQRTDQARMQALQAQQDADRAKLQREQAELQKQQAEVQRSQAQQTAAQANAEAAQERAAAEQAKQQALQQQEALTTQAQVAQQQAQTAEQRAQQSAQEREQMRQRMLAQLNQVMQTRDTARGLIVNMNDVLFDTGKATLRPDAKIRLAKVAGIIAAYPDTHLNIEGYTDSTGSPEYNKTLSERRAATVRDFLISQGVSVNNVVAQGFGPENPIASNNTPAGRQMNRRVDLVVNGPEISSDAGANGWFQSSSGATGGVVGSATGQATPPSETGTAGAVGGNASPSPESNPAPAR